MAGERLVEASESREEAEEVMAEEIMEEGLTEVPGANIIRGLMLKQLSYGYTIEVGCRILAIESKETLIKVLTEYINNPSSTEKKFREGKLFVHQVAR